MKSFNVSKQVNGSRGPFYNMSYCLCQRQKSKIGWSMGLTQEEVFIVLEYNFRVYMKDLPTEGGIYFLLFNGYWLGT